jgi:hypothetical protein
VEITTLAEGEHALSEWAQSLGLGQGGADAAVLNE